MKKKLILLTTTILLLGGLTKYEAKKPKIEHIHIEFVDYKAKLKQDLKEFKVKKAEEERIRLAELEKARLLEEERKRQEELEKQQLINRLGYEPKKIVKVNCRVTYYYADNTQLQGGYNDKRGVPLKSHNEPIVALPSDVSYGSYIEFDKPVRGNTLYKNVDTGQAIKWLDSNTIVVDVFVKEANSYNQLINMVQNTTTTATIYYK